MRTEKHIKDTAQGKTQTQLTIKTKTKHVQRKIMHNKNKTQHNAQEKHDAQEGNTAQEKNTMRTRKKQTKWTREKPNIMHRKQNRLCTIKNKQNGHNKNKTT